MNAVGKLSTYISQGVNTFAGPFHPFGGAIDIIAVQQQDGSFKSTPWNVKFGKFQGVLKHREKLVDVAVNDVDADFHMYLDHTGEAYFLEDADSDNDDNLLLLSSAPSSGEEGSSKPAAEYQTSQEVERDARPSVQDIMFTKNEGSSVSGDEGSKVRDSSKEDAPDFSLENCLDPDEKVSDLANAKLLLNREPILDGLDDSVCVSDLESVNIRKGVLKVTKVSNEEATKVSSEELTSTRDAIRVHSEAPDENGAHNRERTHSTLNNAVGLEECRVSGPASALIADNVLTSFVNVASSSDQLSGGLNDASTPSQISMSESFTPVVGLESLTVVEATKTNFVVSDSSEVNKTPADEENVYAGSKFVAESYSGDPSGISLASAVVQLQDDVEGNAKAENIKTSDTREFLSDSGAAFCHEPLNMEREIVSEEKGGTNLENASAENRTDVRDIESPEKTIVLPEESKKEEELSADGKTISEGALVVTDNICAQGNSAGSISRPIRNTHRETAVEQEIAWRKVLENAAWAMKSVPIAASLEMETNLKATDAKDSGTLADSLEKRSWGWWSWRGSVEKKQMNDRRSARISRKLSGRNSKAMEVSPNDSKSAEAHVEVKDSTTELMSGIINHQVGFHVSCTSNADTSTEVEAKKDMLTQQPGLSNHQGSFSEEGRILLERGKETASLSREISKGTSQFETTSELREMESPKSGLKPSRSILSFVFGGSGRAQNPTGLQEHTALPLENTGIQKEQHKEVLVETAEIITELLDRKWSTGKRRSGQIVDKDTRRHSLSSSPQVECGQSFKDMTPINLERDSNAKVDELFYTPSDKTTLDSDTGEKENQFVRGALLLKETKLAQMQGQSELSSCILDEITVEGEHELPHSLNKLSATSSCHEDLLLGSTMSGVNSFPAEANQVQRNNYSETCEQMDFANQSTEQVIPIGHLSEVGVGNRDDFVVKTSSNFHNKSLKSFERAQHLLQQGDLSDDEGNLGDQSTSKSTDPKVGLDKGSRSDCTFLETEVTEDVRGGFHLSPSAGSCVAEPERASADEQSILKNVDTTYLHNLKSLKRCDIPVDQEIGDSIGQFEVDKDAGLMDKGDERIDVRNDNDSDSQVPPYDMELRGVTRCTDLCLPCAANSATSSLAADCLADVALGFSNKTEEKLLSLRSGRYLSFKDVEEYYEPLDSPVNADTEVTEDVFKSCLVLPDLLSPSGEDDDEENGYKAQDLQPVPDLGTSDDDEENGYKAQDLQPVPDLGTSDELYIPLPKDQKPLKVGCNDSIHAKLLSTPIDVPNEAKNYFKWHTVRQLSESMPDFTSKAIDVREASAQKVLSCSLGTLSLQNDHLESLELAFASGRTGLALTANTHLIKLGEMANDSEVNLELEGSKALESPKKNTSPSVFSLPELLPASDQIDTLPMAPVGGKLSSTVTQVNNSDTGFELSLCKHLLTKRMGREAADKAFNSEKVSLESFRSSGASVVGNEKLVVRVGGKYYPWTVAAPLIVGMLAFGQFVVPPNTEGEIVVEVPTPVNYSKTVLNTSTSSAGAWRLWPFLLRRPKTPETLSAKSTLSREALLVASKLALQGPLANDFLHLNGYYSLPLHRHRIRTQVPTSKQLASLNLKGGKNKITFTFFTSVLGRQQVDAHIYLWKWNARIVISDVDGTITRSDVLGQVMPLVGKDWTQTGVTRLFSAIKENGYELMFLSARAISQAYLTRQFLLNLKQDGEPLPDGPVVISPDGLFPSLYREVIRRAPHEFKIACLQDVRALFPSECNPFYAGFGNRDTDEISYLKVGIPRGKIFIINPKGEVIVNNLASVKTYTSLHKLVNDMFPPVTYTEQEDFNSWNFWKMPLPEIEDETNMKSSKVVISKGAGDLKKITKS